MKKNSLLALITTILTLNLKAQSLDEFPGITIDPTIISKRGFAQQFENLKSKCDWQNRIGRKIDVFWLASEKGNLFGYVYEYFMDCDNVRLIYWYDNPSGTGKPVDFMIENLEDESKYVVSKKKHLKNRKKYQHLLN